MWDPSGYQDTDYGLEAEERFEPSDGGDWDDVDTSMPHIRTMLGPIPPDALGMCLPFEHLTAHDGAFEVGSSHLLPARDNQIVSELEMFFMSGGRSVVNVSSDGGSQSANRLQTIAKRVPVHILSAHAIGGEVSASDSNISGPDSPTKDGIPHWAGLLLVDDASRSSDTSLANLAIRVARFQRDSGLPLVIRGELHGGRIDFVTQLRERRERSQTIIVTLPHSHIGQWTLLLELVRHGAWIGFEGLGLHGVEFDTLAATQCVRLMQEGFTDRILLSPGLSDPSQFVSQGGGPGWTYLQEHFTLALMSAGAEALAVREVLLENPSKALTVNPLVSR